MLLDGQCPQRVAQRLGVGPRRAYARPDEELKREDELFAHPR
jgi:hypothetical protein